MKKSQTILKIAPLIAKVSVSRIILCLAFAMECLCLEFMNDSHYAGYLIL